MPEKKLYILWEDDLYELSARRYEWKVYGDKVEIAEKEPQSNLKYKFTFRKCAFIQIFNAENTIIIIKTYRERKTEKEPVTNEAMNPAVAGIVGAGLSDLLAHEAKA